MGVVVGEERWVVNRLGWAMMRSLWGEEGNTMAIKLSLDAQMYSIYDTFDAIFKIVS